jgi:transcriptional regulator with XRE-family HTH domain
VSESGPVTPAGVQKRQLAAAYAARLEVLRPQRGSDPGSARNGRRATRAAGRAQPPSCDAAPALVGSRAQGLSPAARRPRDADAVSDRRLGAASERMMLMRAFGQTMGKLRLDAGLTPGRLDRKCRVSPATISKAENGVSEPRVSLILILCDGLLRRSRHAHRRAAHTPRAQTRMSTRETMAAERQPELGRARASRLAGEARGGRELPDAVRRVR